MIILASIFSVLLNTAQGAGFQNNGGVQSVLAVETVRDHMGRTHRVFVERLANGRTNPIHLRDGKVWGFSNPAIEQMIYQRYSQWKEAPASVRLFVQQYQQRYTAEQNRSVAQQGGHAASYRPAARPVDNSPKFQSLEETTISLCPRTPNGVHECPTVGGVAILKSGQYGPGGYGVAMGDKIVQLNAQNFLPPQVNPGHATYWGKPDPITGRLKTHMIEVKLHGLLKTLGVARRRGNMPEEIDDTFEGSMFIKIGNTPDEICVAGVFRENVPASYMLRAGYPASEFAGNKSPRVRGVSNGGNGRPGDTMGPGLVPYNQKRGQMLQAPPLCADVTAQSLKLQADTIRPFPPPNRGQKLTDSYFF